MLRLLPIYTWILWYSWSMPIRTRRHGHRKFFPSRSGKRTLSKRYRHLNWLANEIEPDSGQIRSKEKREVAKDVERELAGVL